MEVLFFVFCFVYIQAGLRIISWFCGFLLFIIFVSLETTVSSNKVSSPCSLLPIWIFNCMYIETFHCIQYLLRSFFPLLSFNSVISFENTTTYSHTYIWIYVCTTCLNCPGLPTQIFLIQCCKCISSSLTFSFS